MKRAVITERAKKKLQQLGFDQPCTGHIIYDQMREIGLNPDIKALENRQRPAGRGTA